jgi:hypothetical protein
MRRRYELVLDYDARQKSAREPSGIDAAMEVRVKDRAH